MVPLYLFRRSTVAFPALDASYPHSRTVEPFPPSTSHIVNDVRNPYLPHLAPIMFSRSSTLIYTRMYFSCRFDHHAFCGSSPASLVLASQDKWCVSPYSSITLSKDSVPSFAASNGRSHVWKSRGHRTYCQMLDSAQKADSNTGDVHHCSQVASAQLYLPGTKCGSAGEGFLGNRYGKPAGVASFSLTFELVSGIYSSYH